MQKNKRWAAKVQRRGEVKLSFQADLTVPSAQNGGSFPVQIKASPRQSQNKTQIDRAQFRVGIEYFRGACSRRRGCAQVCSPSLSVSTTLSALGWFRTAPPRNRPPSHSLLPSAEAIEEVKYRWTNILKYKRGKKTRTVRTAAVTARY